MFAEAYPDGVTNANLGKAIAQHARDMTRNDAPFNDYLSAENASLPANALRGMERFSALGCTTSHSQRSITTMAVLQAWILNSSLQGLPHMDIFKATTL